MTNEQYIAAAREQYEHEGEVEIADGAKVSRGNEDGAYVMAWVWIRDKTAKSNLEAREECGAGCDHDHGYTCSEDDPDAPDSLPCVKCQTQCDFDGACPKCSKRERLEELLKGLLEGRAGTASWQEIKEIVDAGVLS